MSFFIHEVFNENSSVIIRIKWEEIMISNFINIRTSPSSITIWWVIFTNKFYKVVTVLDSVFIFNINHTLVHFSEIDDSVLVHVTIFIEEIVMFRIDGILKINVTRVVRIKIVHSTNSLFIDIITIPHFASFTWIWVPTKKIWIVRFTIISPVRVFNQH